jgi:hypothetical protein
MSTTGLYYGDLLGADGHAFGYEVDGLDYVIRNGLPGPARRAERRHDRPLRSRPSSSSWTAGGVALFLTGSALNAPRLPPRTKQLSCQLLP